MEAINKLSSRCHNEAAENHGVQIDVTHSLAAEIGLDLLIPLRLVWQYVVGVWECWGSGNDKMEVFHLVASAL